VAEETRVPCPVCQPARRMVTVRVSREGVTLTMHACSSCETRWWERDGARVGLGEALAAVAVSE
jgi:hypothetical protein